MTHRRAFGESGVSRVNLLMSLSRELMWRLVISNSSGSLVRCGSWNVWWSVVPNILPVRWQFRLQCSILPNFSSRFNLILSQRRPRCMLNMLSRSTISRYFFRTYDRCPMSGSRRQNDYSSPTPNLSSKICFKRSRWISNHALLRPLGYRASRRCFVSRSSSML